MSASVGTAAMKRAAPRPTSAGGRPQSNPPRPSSGTKTLNKPASPEVTAAPVKRSSGDASRTKALRVFTKAENGDVALATLIGAYEEKGTNHGRRVYKRIESKQDVSVFLYFWDTRDGADFSGWWFGDKVGGTQVWARAPARGLLPPSSGWSVPWDAPLANNLLLIEHFGGSSSDSSRGDAPAKVATPPSTASKVRTQTVKQESVGSDVVTEVSERVAALEADCQAALRASAELLEASEAGQGDEAVEAATLLKKQQVEVSRALKWVADEMSQARSKGNTQVLPKLSRLGHRLKAVQANVVGELSRAKAEAARAEQSADAANKQASEDARVAQLEERDWAHLQELRPVIKEFVAQAEDTVETVSIIAQSFNMEEDDLNHSAAQNMAEVEDAALTATTALAEARKQINAKMQEVRKYHPAAKKIAVKELEALHNRITEGGKRLNPFKRFREQYEERMAERKAYVDLIEKLGNAELEVEKAQILCSPGDDGQMTEGEIKEADDAIMEAQSAIQSAQILVDKHVKGVDGKAHADAKVRQEVKDVQARAKSSLRKLDDVKLTLRIQREGMMVQQVIGAAHEKLDRVEASLLATTDAEMPFLRGIEVLPEDEALHAVGMCQAAQAKADAAMLQARTFFRAKLADFNSKYSAASAKRGIAELNVLQSRVDAAGRKLLDFKKDTTQRKNQAVLSSVVDKVCEAENSAQMLAQAAKVLTAEKFEELTTESLMTMSAARDKTETAEKEASELCQAARSVLEAKRRDAAIKDPSFLEEVQKLADRLNVATQEVQKNKRLLMASERAIKSKQILTEEEEKMTKAEMEVTKAVTLAAPLANSNPTESSMEEIDAAANAAQLILTSALSSSKLKATSPSVTTGLKAALNKVQLLGKTLQEKLDTVRASAKGQREKVLAESYVKQATQKVETVDAALAKVGSAELPFLKGLESLPITETIDLLKESDTTIEDVLKVLGEARSYSAGRQVEVKKFVESVSKPALDELQKLSDRVNTASQRVSQFRKDTEKRRRSILVHEAEHRIDDIESEVKKATLAAEPLNVKDLDKMSAEAAAAICEKLAGLERTAQEKIEEAKTFLAFRLKKLSGHATQEEQMKKLSSRLQSLQVDFAKAKAASNEREQKFVARKLLTEAEDLVKDLDACINKGTAQADPLLKNSGESFLAHGKVALIVEVLLQLMKDGSLTEDDIFKSICGDNPTVDKAAWVSYLETLPENSGRKDLSFTLEQREAIFDHLDADKDGMICREEFVEMFRERFICIHSIAVTDCFEISKSKTVAKLEPDEVVVALKEAVTCSTSGVPRLNCKVAASGKEGWVSLQGNQGTTYMDRFSPFASLTKSVNRSVEAAEKKALRVSTMLRNKSSELTPCTQGPLAEARTELGKLKQQVSASQKRIEELKRKLAGAIKDFSKREKAEKLAQQDMLDEKAATIIVSPCSEKIGSLEAGVNQLETFLKPLIGADDTEVKGFAKPTSLVEDAEKLVAKIQEDVASAKVVLEEQQPRVAKATRGPLYDAKQSLAKFMTKVDLADKRSKSLLEFARKACLKIVEAAKPRIADAFRLEVQERAITVQELFKELVGDSATTRIPEDTFCQRIMSLPNVDLSEEQARLICRHLDLDLLTIKNLLEQYFIALRQISITTEFDINKGKSHRVVEIGEVVEVLEGPKEDRSLNITRIRARALRDGARGWLSLRGNHGTPFLKVHPKPFFCCASPVPLEPEYSMKSGSTAIRMLKVDEAFEVLEGPRKLVFKDGLRLRGKACSDGAAGWLTVKDCNGVVYAESAGSFYVCRQMIALTDAREIRSSKVLRKLAKEESFKVLEGPFTDESVTRVRCEASKDKLVGWLTLRGNAGTVFAEESKGYYTLTRQAPFKKRPGVDGTREIIRMLEKDEIVEVVEGPEQEKFEDITRVKGGMLSDGSVGWVTLDDKALKPWTPSYNCLSGTVLQDSCTVKTAQTVRRLEVGEVVDLFEGPVEETSLGVMRIRGRAEKDGAQGWLTLRGNQGTVYLAPVAPA
eukprot:TRINITY_DN73779_c0_g1_i1.p1 TRINITY_DN73779_c0_g1~~TRINITY_DN73779_c0_g1_i1.p1  ORF type:complete len:2013 (-),score=491.47 TRINITY_DN73779_c0_g1_i1:180-6218(-)